MLDLFDIFPGLLLDWSMCLEGYNLYIRLCTSMAACIFQGEEIRKGRKKRGRVIVIILKFG